MPYDVPLVLVSILVAAAAAVAVLLARKSDPNRWIWAGGSVALYLIVLNAVRRVVYDDVPAYGAAGTAYDRGEISFAAMERVREDDLAARYKSVATGAVAALLFAIAARRRVGVPRAEDEVVPQLVGSTCGPCGKKIRVARDATACGTCKAVMHVACAVEHRH